MIGTLLATLLELSLPTAVQVGERPPDTIGRDTQHREIRVGDYVGKIVVIDFWASWCSPCMKELTVLDSIQHQVSPDRLVVLAVNYKEGPERFEQISKRLSQNTALTLVDDPIGKAARPYGIKSIPFVVVIGADGKIVDIRHGYSESALPGFIDELNRLLAANTPAPTAAPDRSTP